MPKRAVTNKEIANILREIGLILEAESVAFKPQAYAAAAETVEHLDQELARMYKESGTKCIDDLPGIGKSIAEKIRELVTTGTLKYYTDLKKKYPFDMLAFTAIQNVGPKTALTLYKTLKVRTLGDLERAAKASKIRKVPGFGRKSEDLILKGLGFLRQQEGRFRLHDALPIAEAVVEKLQNISGVTHCDVAGSIRRRKETIGDIDLLMTTTKPKQAIEAFKNLPEVAEVLEEGPTMVRVRYTLGMGGDLRVLKPEEYGSALVHFTGSKEHNVVIRGRAKTFGLKLSEYGLFSAKCGSASGGKGGKRIACRTEEDVYRHLKMQWMPPEIREASGEVEAAIARKVPKLVGYDDLKGDLQVQTLWTDGSASIEEMAMAAKKRGLSYMAVTDHSKGLTITKGLDERRLKQQGKEIDRLNRWIKGFRILKSTECDILKDGSLDMSDAVLKTLDLVCVSVHSFFQMEEKEMTERIIRALKHPLVNILFHPTGRIVNAREAYRVDMPRVIRAAKEYGVALEANSSERLDLKDTHIRMAVEAGVKLVVDSDAHTPEHFDYLPFGIAQARRGWATKADVLNTKSAEELLTVLKKMKR